MARACREKTFQHRTALFTDWLVKRLLCFTIREQALSELLTIKTDKSLSVSNISEWLCYSPSPLSRIFYELTGMYTEQTVLYLKYLKAIELIHYSNLSHTQIAYACEFSDQSHFNKSFKSFTALTPNEYRNKKSEIIGHYFENVR